MYVLRVTTCFTVIIFIIFKRFQLKVLQATVMISSIVVVACLGIWSVGGVTEVWNRAVEGGRIFPPE